MRFRLKMSYLNYGGMKNVQKGIMSHLIDIQENIIIRWEPVISYCF